MVILYHLFHFWRLMKLYSGNYEFLWALELICQRGGHLIMGPCDISDCNGYIAWNTSWWMMKYTTINFVAYLVFVLCFFWYCSSVLCVRRYSSKMILVISLEKLTMIVIIPFVLSINNLILYDLFLFLGLYV